MRARTAVSRMTGALVVLVLAATGARQVTTHEARQRPTQRPPALTEDTLHLVVGDTLTLALGSADTSHVAMLLGDTVHLGVREDNAVAVAASFVSSATAVVTVSGEGQIRASSAGDALITATAISPPIRSVAIPVHVMERRQAVNEMIATVCPNEDDRSFTATAPVTADLPIIHEYHDCQRLIAHGKYGPTVGIFADNNAVISKSWRSFAGGKVAAIIVNFADSKYSGPYDPLGINPGVSCLVLKADSPGQWYAAIVGPRMKPTVAPFGHVYGTCDDQMTWANVPPAAMAKLAVREEGGVDVGNRPIAPPTARWDWDPEHKVNYIGVKCGEASWCEIGPPGFHSSAPITLKNGSAPLFRGYYDQQYLADPVTKQVSTVFGTILPGPDADTSRMKHKHQHWYHVAQLRFEERALVESSSYSSYRKKYGAETPAGARSAVAVSDYFLAPKFSLWKYSGYFGRFNNHLLNLEAIKYRLHVNSQPVPTVRWRWDVADEMTWSYCDPEGCCENVQTLVSM